MKQTVALIEPTGPQIFSRQHYVDTATGNRVYTLRELRAGVWLCMYPDGEEYTQHEAFLEPADD